MSTKMMFGLRLKPAPTVVSPVTVNEQLLPVPWHGPLQPANVDRVGLVLPGISESMMGVPYANVPLRFIDAAESLDKQDQWTKLYEETIVKRSR